MPDLFHSAKIDQTLDEVRAAAQQAQVTLAAAREVLQHIDAIVLQLGETMHAVITSVQQVIDTTNKGVRDNTFTWPGNRP